MEPLEKIQNQKPRYEKTQQSETKGKKQKTKRKKPKASKSFQIESSSLDLGLSLRILRNQRLKLSLGVERNVFGNFWKFLKIFPDFDHYRQ